MPTLLMAVWADVAQWPGELIGPGTAEQSQGGRPQATPLSSMGFFFILLVLAQNACQRPFCLKHVFEPPLPEDSSARLVDKPR
jgi:hypothetical protein